MPCRARLSLPGVPQHLIQRGNNRQACFFSDEDYRIYLEWLAEHAAKTGCCVHAYVLMTNHVHLLVSADRGDASGALMKALGQCESRLSAQRYAVGRAFPFMPDSGRSVFAGLPALHRTESGTRWNGRASGRIPLVELSGQRGGRGQRTDPAAFALRGAWARCGKPASGLPRVVPP